jgi:hypothetical protein
MSAIVEIQERIQNTVALIARYEKVAAQPNSPPSLRASIQGLEKLQESLEREFEKIAHDEELEICRYRLLPEQGERPALAAIAKAWTQYQTLFSSVYDAIKNRNEPKKKPRTRKPRTRKESLAETQFAFSYTFSGSIGVALTVPAQQTDYFMARLLERTAQTIAEMAKAQTSEALAGFVDRLGVSPVAKLGAWVDAHVAFGAGAGVEWDISSGPAPTLLVQVQEFKALKQAMDKISEPTEATETVVGLLVAADMDKHTFRMKLDSGDRISGEFVDAINQKQRAELPQRYSALVRTTTTIKPAIEKKEVSHFLVQLLKRLQV